MIGIRWTGADGSTWDLRRGDVRLTDGGIQGLGMLEFKAFTQDTALRDGQWFTGWKGLPRNILLPVKIGHTGMSAQQFLEVEAAWFRTMRPDRPGTITVTDPNGGQRSLKARFVDDGGYSLKTDPTRHKTIVVPFRLVADEPWWLGDPFENEFTSVQVGDGRNFFGGGELGVEYSWLGEPHASMSRYVSAARSRLNRHVRPDARLDWAILAGSAPTGVVVPQHLRGSDIVPESYFQARIGSQQVGTTRFGVGSPIPTTVEAGKTYTLAIKGRSVIDRQSYIVAKWHRADLSVIGETEGAHEPHDARTFEERSVSVIAPAGAAAVTLWIAWEGAAPVGAVDGTGAAVWESPVKWDYFDGDSGKGPLFTIGRSSASSQQKLVNPGDVPSWPKITVFGPVEGFSVKIGTGVLSSDQPILAGDRVVIETSPTLQTIVGINKDGENSNWLRRMKSLGFRSVPDGGSLDVRIEINGTGRVTVRGLTRYFKAWG